MSGVMPSPSVTGIAVGQHFLVAPHRTGSRLERFEGQRLSSGSEVVRARSGESQTVQRFCAGE